MRRNLIRVLSSVTAVSAAAGVLVYRTFRHKRIRLKKRLTVDRPPEESYRYWRDFTNLPKFMDFIDRIQILDEKLSRWTAVAPGDLDLSWNTEITADSENEMIAWRSLEGSLMDARGSVRFEPAPAGRGTVLSVTMQYVPPAGKVGSAFTNLFARQPGARLEEALRRFKQLLETGEIATTSQKSTIQRTAEVRRLEVPSPARSVETASEDSFPASDPPAWTGTGV
jgi:uncharacterized membrane protein